MAQRTATEVLLSIEGKIDQLNGYYRNIDMNIKLVLNKLNRSVSETIEPASGSLNQERIKNALRAVPGNHSVKVNGNVLQPLVGVPANEYPFDDDGNRELIEEAVPKGSLRNQRIPVDAVKAGKLSVSQQIFAQDGDPLYLAQVDISIEGKLIKQTRTNAKGRWIAPLAPGQYDVRITKRNSGDDRNPVDLKYTISIPHSNGPLEIPSPEFK